MTHPIQAPSMEEFKDILREHELKATAQRLAVHSAMLELEHASADMVCSHIAEHGVKVSVASVYNILSDLALRGIYKHRLSANNKMYFDVCTLRHIHLYDVYNHSYMDYRDDDLLRDIEDCVRERRFRGYKIDAVDVSIICHPSRRKAPLSY